MAEEVKVVYDSKGLQLLRQQVVEGRGAGRPPNVSLAYSVVYKGAHWLRFTLDVSTSVNMGVVAGEKMVTALETVVRSGEAKSVGTVVVLNPDQSWSLRPSISWKEFVPDAQTLGALASKDEGAVRQDIEGFHNMGLSDVADSLPLPKLLSALAKDQLRYVDLSFPPEESSLFEKDSPFRGQQAISWRRAWDIFPVRPSLFTEHEADRNDISPHDINQGKLGDCWLMCALCSMTEVPELVRNVFDVDGKHAQLANEAGVYELRFCKNGAWQNVRVDDYIPCVPQQGPLYARAHGPELWVMLIEKAYAKMSGGYDALRGGLAYEAMMDLTGCPTTVIDVLEAQPDALWKQLRLFDALDNLMSASVPGEDKWSAESSTPLGGPGLVSGHAYSLKACVEIDGHRLVQLRNPWGKFEWTGRWSDTSADWTPRATAMCMQQCGFDVERHDPSDGQFFMAFEDFLQFFTRLNICRLHPGPGTDWVDYRQKLHVRYSGSDEEGWTCETSSLFHLSIKQRSNVWISLHQEDERSFLANPYIDLSVIVLRVTESGKYLLYHAGGGDDSRQIQLHLEGMEPGSYVVVPFTSGHRRWREEGETKRAAAIRLLDSDGTLTRAAHSVVDEIFLRFDEDMDGLLDDMEVEAFLNALGDPNLKVADFLQGRRTHLGKENLAKYFETHTEAQLLSTLRKLGYTADLNLRGARTLVASVHSSAAVEFSKFPFNRKIHDRAVALWIMRDGEKRVRCEGKLTVYEHVRGSAGVSLAVYNGFDATLSCTVDCSRAQGVRSHRASLVAEDRVPAKQLRVMHHLMPADPQGAWGWSYKLGGRLDP